MKRAYTPARCEAAHLTRRTGERRTSRCAGDYARGGGSSGATLRVAAVPGGPATSSHVRPTIVAPDAPTLVMGATPHAPSAVHVKPRSMRCAPRAASPQPACSSGTARTDILSASLCADMPTSACTRPRHAYPLPTSMNWPSRSMSARAAPRVGNRIREQLDRPRRSSLGCASTIRLSDSARTSGVAHRSCRGIADIARLVGPYGRRARDDQ